MHNMIVEDERDSEFEKDYNYDQLSPPDTNYASRSSNDFNFFLQRYQAIQNQSTHSQLKKDLVEHQWKLHEKRLRKEDYMGMNPGSDSSSSGSGDGDIYS